MLKLIQKNVNFNIFAESPLYVFKLKLTFYFLQCINLSVLCNYFYSPTELFSASNWISRDFNKIVLFVWK